MSIRKDVDYPGRWDAATTEYPMGKPKNRTTSTSKDGSYLEKKWIGDYEALLGAALGETGETPNGVQDTALDSQIYKAMQKGRQVLPFNLDWNGFMDPSHQSSLPSPSGYPGNSSGGEAVYSSGDEITLGIFSGSNLNSISSDDDGWIFSGSIYKEYAMTAEQISLIDVNSINVFVKDEAGVSYFWKNGDTGVTVSKPASTTLRVTLDSAIFGVITKLWRFFVTEKVGYVGELPEQGLIDVLRGELLRLRVMSDVSSIRVSDVIYTNTSGVDLVVYVRGLIDPAILGGLSFSIDSVDTFGPRIQGSGSQNSGVMISFVVPSGSTYSVSSLNNATISQWVELRI